MLTISNPLLGVTMDENKVKQALYKLYDFTKGGTDIVDQRMGFYTSKVKISMMGIGMNVRKNDIRENDHPACSEIRARCHVCIELLRGGENQNKISAIYTLCQKCDKHACKKHLNQSCNACE